METPAEAFQTNAAARCAIIITHYNYSQYVQSAIESVLCQTHAKLECIVVDDASDEMHRQKLRTIVKDLGDERVQLVELNENRDQILAMFEGLQRASADFVGFLDPDDIYEPEFLEKLLNAHLNPTTVAAFASCEMGRFRVGGGPLSRCYSGFRRRAEEQDKICEYQTRLASVGFSHYYPPWQTGWLWTTTSGLLFRSDVLKLLVPVDLPSDFRDSGDTYLCFGAHMLGGSLFVDEVLSWRGVHATNPAHPEIVFSEFQVALKDGFPSRADGLKKAAVDSFLANGARKYLTVASLGEILTTHFDSATLFAWMSESDAVRDLLERYAANVSWDATPP